MCEEAYKAGASEVTVDWHDDIITRQKYLNADNKVFDVFPEWQKVKFNEIAENKVGVLNIYAEDPNCF